MNSEINNRIAQLAMVRALKGYTWNDIADQINSEFGTSLSWDACRKRASHIVFEPETITDVDEELEDFRAPELQMLTELKDERNQVNALFRRMDREETLKAMAKDAATIISKTKPFINFSTKNSDEPLNESLLLISDWHYGIEIDNYLNCYNIDICKDRVAELTNAVIDKIKSNNITRLKILNLGDMIAGIIHLQLRINSRIDVLTQIMEVSEILAEMLYKLSDYVDVDYYSVLDNHSRIDPNKKEALQLESLARITSWYLKERFKDAYNIIIHNNDIDEDIATFYINDDYLVVGVHGDKDKPANIIPKLNVFVKETINLVCAAHRHHFQTDEDNRTMLISNGSLMGTDEYAFEKRLDSLPSQTLITFKQTQLGTDIDGIFKLNSYI